jgi:hypothetical protein
MEFTLYGFDVYQAEVDDKGIDFVIRKGQDRYYDIQVKSVRSFNYVFFRKECFELRENLYAAIVIMDDGETPKLFLIPSIAWREPNSLFINRAYEPPAKSKPEWGLNLSARNQQLLGDYSFENVITKL